MNLLFTFFLFFNTVFPNPNLNQPCNFKVMPHPYVWNMEKTKWETKQNAGFEPLDIKNLEVVEKEGRLFVSGTLIEKATREIVIMGAIYEMTGTNKNGTVIGQIGRLNSEGKFELELAKQKTIRLLITSPEMESVELKLEDCL